MRKSEKIKLERDRTNELGEKRMIEQEKERKINRERDVENRISEEKSSCNIRIVVILILALYYLGVRDVFILLLLKFGVLMKLFVFESLN